MGRSAFSVFTVSSAVEASIILEFLRERTMFRRLLLIALLAVLMVGVGIPLSFATAPMWLWLVR